MREFYPFQQRVNVVILVHLHKYTKDVDPHEICQRFNLVVGDMHRRAWHDAGFRSFIAAELASRPKQVAMRWIKLFVSQHNSQDPHRVAMFRQATVDSIKRCIDERF